ncbi:MAG: hypothetical protein JO345_13045 [Streptosporangiaceae bacterium]|nr:hypothetical protein [Streptosporangiaceae bacterium]
MSVAPEIALLAQRVPAQPGLAGTGAGAATGAAARPTIGALAGELKLIASHPERWWGAVRFSRGRSSKIDLEFPGSWVVVLAPDDPGIYCDCELMTVVAGAVTEESVADGGAVTTMLRPGPMRVHGQGQVHQIRASGGFAVSLHIRGGSVDQPAG